MRKTIDGECPECRLKANLQPFERSLANLPEGGTTAWSSQLLEPDHELSYPKCSRRRACRSNGGVTRTVTTFHTG